MQILSAKTKITRSNAETKLLNFITNYLAGILMTVLSSLDTLIQLLRSIESWKDVRRNPEQLTQNLCVL